MSNYKHDVAFSFLSVDEQIAADLHDRLKDQVASWIYTENRKDMLGPDGYQRFGEVFRSEARTVVVVYRDGWGDRGYTAAEKAAVDQRVQSEGLAFLFVIVPPDAAMVKLPAWIPPSHVYCHLTKFSLEAAAACIGEHVRRAGAAPKIETATDVIRRIRDQEVALARRRAFRETQAVTAALRELESLFDALARIACSAPELLSAPTFNPDRTSISVFAPSSYLNLTLAVNRAVVRTDRDPHLSVHLWRDSAPGFCYPPYADPEYTAHYQMDIDDDGHHGWRRVESAGRLLMSTAAVADLEMKAMLARFPGTTK
jgi:hypothetical protein